ncbi:hypothetical protein BS78_02G101300 [Paspalum vaginatum]|nr:hypothetical protein BS78_02G101300 [Paspalum vaginatum]
MRCWSRSAHAKRKGNPSQNPRRRRAARTHGRTNPARKRAPYLRRPRVGVARGGVVRLQRRGPLGVRLRRGSHGGHRGRGDRGGGGRLRRLGLLVGRRRHGEIWRLPKQSAAVAVGCGGGGRLPACLRVAGGEPTGGGAGTQQQQPAGQQQPSRAWEKALASHLGFDRAAAPVYASPCARSASAADVAPRGWRRGPAGSTL